MAFADRCALEQQADETGNQVALPRRKHAGSSLSYYKQYFHSNA